MPCGKHLLKIAYVLNTSPQPSHSFIRREIAAVEAAGHEVLRLAMRRSDLPLVDPLDHAEAAKTTYVLDRGPVRLLLGLVGLALKRPGQVLRAARQAMRMGRRSEMGRLRHLIYLAEAGHVARICTRAGVRHVHAHFGTNAASVAHLAHLMGGPRYSFTVHGPEEFDAPRALSLPEKIAAAAFVVGVSSFGRSQLCRWVGAEHWPRLHVVHCGIELARFATTTPLPEGELRLVSIGRFAEQKGQAVLIDALARSTARPYLTLVGDGPLRHMLEARIAELGLSDRVRLTGWLDEDGVRQEIDAAHALIMPSFAEGLPMVIMESMAAARPVIATYIAGIPELVRPETGWLVPAGSVDDLALAIDALAAIPRAELARMGEAARALALSRHDAAVEAARLLRLIEGG